MAKGDIPVAPIPGLGYATNSSRKGRTSMFAMFPLLTLSLIIYTVAAFALGDGWTVTQLIDIQVVSGDQWLISYGHGFVMISMVFLFIELLRATKTGTDSLVNHALSAILFIVTLLLFIIVPGYGNSIFFILVMMTFLDFMAGFIVTTVTARRDFGVAA